jgi:hypothetical protein
MFYNSDGQLVSLLASWTDVGELDAFAQAAAGRSWFCTDDLRRLCSLIDELKTEVAPHVK